MRSFRFGAVAAAFIGFAVFGLARAEVKPHNLFSDNMVLQRDMPVPVWGTAEEGEKVTVRFQGQEVSATTANGKWLVKLSPLKATDSPQRLSISNGTSKIEFQNVLIGEVWICSGQSNMEWSMKQSSIPPGQIAKARNPLLRLYTVPRTEAQTPTDNVKREAGKGAWHECNPDSLPSFSAVAYYFGRDMQKALNVPVGLINTSWGGTPAEAWTSKAVLQANAGAVTDLQKNATLLYNGMIASLIPYAIRGAIWYQGESNAFSMVRAEQYRTLLPAMIKNWRHDWKQGDFPFLIVQLAPWLGRLDNENLWPTLREAQLITAATLPKTGMAVITDVGHPTDIHPKQKEPVGARLALAARAIAHDERIVYSGPVYQEMKVEGNKAILTFKHLGSGLVARDGALIGFTIAGADKKFVDGEAEIVGDTIVVSSDKVAKPAAVRFGWSNHPVCNLFNKEGLPATPFRTDGPGK